jgi:hypothetical protein
MGVVDNRPEAALDSLAPAEHPYACALVGLARARAASADPAGVRQAYEQFLDLWKHADHDLPLLADVRRELAALPASGAK